MLSIVRIEAFASITIIDHLREERLFYYLLEIPVSLLILSFKNGLLLFYDKNTLPFTGFILDTAVSLLSILL